MGDGLFWIDFANALTPSHTKKTEIKSPHMLVTVKMFSIENVIFNFHCKHEQRKDGWMMRGGNLAPFERVEKKRDTALNFMNSFFLCVYYFI